MKIKQVYEFLMRDELYSQIPEDEEVSRQRFALFRIFSFTGICACMGTASKMFFTIDNAGVLPLLIMVLSNVFIINYFSVRKVTSLNRAYLLMLVAAFLLLHLVSYSCGGIRTAGTMYFSVVILYSFMLLGNRAGKWFTGLVLGHLVYLFYISTHTSWTSFDFFKNDIRFINEDFLINGILTFLLIASQSSYLQSGKNVVIQGLEKSKRSLEEKNKMLVEKNRLLKTYALKLEKSNRELDKFASVASHDLKAPLRAIGTLTGMIEEDSGDQMNAETRAHFNTIKSRVNRMEQLINALLEYSKADRLKGEESAVDTRQLAEELRFLLCMEDHITLNISKDLPVIFADRHKIKLVFSNLISNAILHADKSLVVIDLGCRQENGSWVFSLADNGPGIDPSFHEKIFVIFQTLSPRDTLESMGAGLAITKKIVEEAGGTIWVESVPGKGAAFHFSIPKTRETGIEVSSLHAIV